MPVRRQSPSLHRHLLAEDALALFEVATTVHHQRRGPPGDRATRRDAVDAHLIRVSAPALANPLDSRHYAFVVRCVFVFGGCIDSGRADAEQR